MAEEPSMPYYLPIAGGRVIGFIPFPWVLVLCEMSSVSSRIWTRVSVSISHNDNDYTTVTSIVSDKSIFLPRVSIYHGLNCSGHRAYAPQTVIYLIFHRVKIWHKAIKLLGLYTKWDLYVPGVKIPDLIGFSLFGTPSIKLSPASKYFVGMAPWSQDVIAYKHNNPIRMSRDQLEYKLQTYLPA